MDMLAERIGHILARCLWMFQ